MALAGPSDAVAVDGDDETTFVRGNRTGFRAGASSPPPRDGSAARSPAPRWPARGAAAAAAPFARRRSRAGREFTARRGAGGDGTWGTACVLF